MKAEIKVTKEVEIKTLLVNAGVRYWEDASVNGVEDAEGDLIPCRNGDIWEPIIDIDSGIITNWAIGTSAKIHYKVCDAGTYKLADENGEIILQHEGYVVNMMCPEGEGYGDYIIMNIDEEGKIQNWKSDIDDFLTEED